MTEENIFTEFNSNKATLIRIDNALKSASNFAFCDKFADWFKCLAFIRREVIVKMDDDQIKECNKMFLALEKDLALLERSNGSKNSFNTKIDNKLDAFEIFLRQIMNDKGMLLKDSERESGL